MKIIELIKFMFVEKLLLTVIAMFYFISAYSTNNYEIYINKLADKGQKMLLKGDLDSAEFFYRYGIKASYSLRDTNRIIRLNCKLADVLAHKGNYKEANDSLFRALRIAEITNCDSIVLIPLLFLADMNIRQLDSSQASYYIKRANKIVVELIDNRFLGYFYNLVLYYHITFKIVNDKAFEIADKAASVASEKFDTLDFVMARSGKSILYLMQGDKEKGISVIKENIEIQKKIGHFGGLATDYLNLGVLYLEEKNFDLAESYLRQAEELYLKLDKKLLGEVYLLLSNIYFEQSNYKKALEYHKEYTVLKDSIFSHEKTKYINELAIEYKTEKKEQEITLLNAQNKLKDLENQIQKKNQRIFLYLTALFLFAIIISFFFTFRYYRQKQRIKLEQTEKEKMRAELTMLKNQISPHVMFNSLNTIYYQLNEDVETAGDMVLKFADLLRFQLYECDSDFINIEKEIQYIREFVAFQKLRKSLRCRIELNIDTTIKNIKITPLLIIPLLENAFKYVSNEKDRDNYIIIDLKKKNNALFFKIENTIFEQGNNNPHKGGIGIQNLKNRLELIYPKKHILKLVKLTNVYQAKILIYV